MPPITRNNKRVRPPTPPSSDDESEETAHTSNDDSSSEKTNQSLSNDELEKSTRTSSDNSSSEETNQLLSDDDEHQSIDLTKESEGSSSGESGEYEDSSLKDFIGNHPDDGDLPDSPPPPPPLPPGLGGNITVTTTTTSIPLEEYIRILLAGGEDEDFNTEDLDSSGDSQEDQLSEDHYEKNPNCGVEGPCDTCQAEYLERKQNRKRKNKNNTVEQKKKKRKKSKKLPPIDKTKIDIEENITTLDDLLEIIDKYEDKPTLDYSINIKYLKALKAPLLELKTVVGLADIKQQIVDQILFLLSHLQDDDQMLHTVIYGAPGSGKTMMGQILAKIYAALGYSNGKFKIVKASDLIAGYIGQTAIKTQKVIDQAKGGVLFIDEAYALGSRDDRDGFSKEAIDQINQNLTERRNEFVCIIAGYKEQLNECFFAYNPGLNRRFPFRYEIKSYGMEELHAIFHSRLVQSGWTTDKIPISLFHRHEKYLTEKGGDMEIISQMTKLAYSRRTFGKHQDPAKHLTLEDVEAGFKLFLNNDEVKNRPKHMSHDQFFKTTIQPTMYV